MKQLGVFVLIACGVILCAALIGLSIVYAPRCKPGDEGFKIGSVVLLGGCK